TLGIGAGLASTFEPLRPLFTAITVVALAIGFYVVYGRRSTPVCGPDGACATPARRVRDRVVLWIATLVALLFWSFNYWSLLLVGTIPSHGDASHVQDCPTARARIIPCPGVLGRRLRSWWRRAAGERGCDASFAAHCGRRAHDDRSTRPRRVSRGGDDVWRLR